MQIKSLSIFKKKTQQQSQAEVPKQPQNPRRSPNLLSNSYYSPPKIVEQKSIIILLAKITVVLVQGIFLCVLFYNFKLQKDLIAIEKEIVANEQQLSTQAKEEKLITTLLVQTSNYKKLKEERITVSDKINLIYNGIPNDIKLASLTLNNSNDIDIDVQAKEVLSISLLINKYLESETVDHITIKSARLSTRDNSFSAELLIDFK